MSAIFSSSSFSRSAFFIQRSEDSFALGRSQIFQNVRQFRRMHIRQPFVLDAQLDAPRRIHLDHVHKMPGNSMSAELPRNRFQRGARQHSFEDAAESPAHADLHLGHPQQMGRALPHPFQVHIVYADHFSPVDVDNLPIHQVLLQIEVVALVFERHQSARGTQLECAGRRLHHVLGGHNRQSGTSLEHQASHLAGVGSGGYRNVLELSPQVPLRIGHRSAEQRGKANPGCSARLHKVSLFLRCKCTRRGASEVATLRCSSGLRPHSPIKIRQSFSDQHIRSVFVPDRRAFSLATRPFRIQNYN
jgi:hypothetical protein